MLQLIILKIVITIKLMNKKEFIFLQKIIQTQQWFHHKLIMYIYLYSVNIFKNCIYYKYNSVKFDDGPFLTNWFVELGFEDFVTDVKSGKLSFAESKQKDTKLSLLFISANC